MRREIDPDKLKGGSSNYLKVLDALEKLERARLCVGAIHERKDVSILINPFLNALYDKIYGASVLLEAIDWEKIREI